MGGEIRVSSTLDRGSLFIFELAFECYQSGDERDSTTPEIPMLREGITILVVEDNDLNQMLTKEILQERGAEVIVAGNGEEAVRLIENGLKVDLILMDIQMPIMDGREATSIIRMVPGYETVPSWR